MNHMQWLQELLMNKSEEMSNQISDLDEHQNVLHNSIEKAINMQEYSIQFHNQTHQMQENAIQQLLKSQDELSNHFQRCFEQHDQVLHQQEETIHNLDDLQEKTTLLQQETMESQDQVKHMYDWQHETLLQTQHKIQHIANFSENAYAHLMFMINKMLDTLDKIYNLDLQILINYLSIQSYAFHVAWALTIYFATIPEFCRELRIWMFLSVMITFFIERCSINQAVYELFESSSWIFSYMTLSSLSKIIRKIMVTLNIIGYVYCALHFKDVEKENMLLLSQITNRMQSPQRSRNTIRWASSKYESPKNARGFVFKRSPYFHMNR